MRGNNRSGFRVAACSASFFVLIAAAIVRGDLYTGGVLALDWLVDSSDEIYHVRIAPSDANRHLVADPLKRLKPHPVNSIPPDEQAQRLQLPRQAKLGEEWLLFVCLTPDGAAKVFQGINLSRPMASHRTAAITRQGEPLRNRQGILAAVDARIRLGRRLPPRCDRGAMRIWKDDWSSSCPFGDPAPLEEYIGHARVKIDCNYWAEPGPHNEDTWVSLAVVSIEPGDHARLLEASRLGDKYTGSPAYYHPLHSLVNFPGEETEKYLLALTQKFGNNYSDSRNRKIAQDILAYFRYRLPVSDPLNGELVGAWRLEGRRERINIQLEKDNTFTATAGDFPHPYTRGNPRRTWRGKGYWVVRDGRLSIARTHANSERIGRTIFQDKLILKATPTEVVLQGGPPMKRDQ